MSSPKLAFPNDALTPKGGEIYCHIFENEHIGLARNLFWSIRVEFEPVQYGADQFTCSMTCEWIPWPLRNWRELDGRRLVANYGERGIESSFYMTEHDTGTHTKIFLRHSRANVFTVKMDMEVDFHGYYGGDENPAMTVHAEVDVPFIGLLMTPGNLFPKPTTPTELRQVASEFVDLAAYVGPEMRRNHGFIFHPSAAAKAS
jgi:hypothetical protein